MAVCVNSNIRITARLWFLLTVPAQYHRDPLHPNDELHHMRRRFTHNSLLVSRFRFKKKKKKTQQGMLSRIKTFRTTWCNQRSPSFIKRRSWVAQAWPVSSSNIDLHQFWSLKRTSVSNRRRAFLRLRHIKKNKKSPLAPKPRRLVRMFLHIF